MEDDKFKLDFARKTYDEVLDATKHQDDKIGRFLTAIAFLFTGAVALGVRTDIPAVKVAIGRFPRALPAMFLGLFLALSIFAVLLLLVALGPNLNLPSPESEGGPSVRLFFLSMARTTAEGWWESQWRADPPTTRGVTKDYVLEAHNLAVKTNFKYGRTNEARAVFSLALLFLVLSVSLGMEAISRAQASGHPVIPWDLLTRTIVGLLIAVFAFVLAYDYLRLEQSPINQVKDPSRKFGIWPLYSVLLGAPALVLFCLLPSPTGSLFWARWACMGVLTAISLALLLRFRRRPERLPELRGWIACYVLAYVATIWVVYHTFASRSQVGLLVLALSVVAALELPRLFRSFWAWRRHLNELAKNPITADGNRADAF